MPQFKVVLDGIKLNERQASALSNSIQRSVLAALADIDTKGDEGSLILEKLGPETRGIIAVFLDTRRPDFDRFKKVNEQFDASF